MLYLLTIAGLLLALCFVPYPAKSPDRICFEDHAFDLYCLRAGAKIAQRPVVSPHRQGVNAGRLPPAWRGERVALEAACRWLHDVPPA